MTEQCKHEKLVEGYYGHDCADCGELVYPYGCEPWNDGPDDEDYGWEDESDYPAAGRGDDWGDDDEGEFDCGWVRGVGCQLAGTEEHDFECPFREELERGLRLTRARQEKRAAAQQKTKGEQ